MLVIYIFILKAVGQQYAISKQACGVIYESVQTLTMVMN